ncbi:MAG: hypothetical protein IPL84_04460 [Chitinophagaceae bacterium]|nr:hypothetical protein [Chitinophagaceae bacterium]
MPKLKTNAERIITLGIQPPVTSPAKCTSTYDEYKDQRVEQSDLAAENIEELTDRFKTKISAPIKAINPNMEMGEYFVIPVSELREMLDASGDNPEFIHICNAIREAPNSEGVAKTFPVVFLVPVKQTVINGDNVYSVCKNTNSVYIEAYPCPPSTNCPHTGRLTEGLFKSNIVLNDFNALK